MTLPESGKDQSDHSTDYRQTPLMIAIRDVNTRKLLQRYVYKTASARIEVYDATKITCTATAILMSPDPPVLRACEGLARETSRLALWACPLFNGTLCDILYLAMSQFVGGAA